MAPASRDWALAVFPAHAGMNRRTRRAPPTWARVPRTRGDEPVPLGLRVRVDDVRERLGYAAPGADDDVLSAQPAAAALSRPPAVPLALAAARARNPSPSADPLAAVLNAIDGDEWQTLAAPLIEPVLAQAKADPDGLLNDIASAYPAMNADALTERLARILFVADVYGREGESG